jgi:lactate permease
VTKLPVDTLSATVGRQLPIFALIVPFWLVWALAGRKATFEVWPAALTVGVSFGLCSSWCPTSSGRSSPTSWPRWSR